MNKEEYGKFQIVEENFNLKEIITNKYNSLSHN
jgi:hypothetical protein